MAADGGCLSLNDRQRHSSDTCVGDNARHWRAMSRSYPRVSRNMPDLHMPLVRHATEVKYVRTIWEMLRTDISSEGNVVDLSCCFLPLPLRSLELIRDVETWGQTGSWKWGKGRIVCSLFGTISSYLP